MHHLGAIWNRSRHHHGEIKHIKCQIMSMEMQCNNTWVPDGKFITLIWSQNSKFILKTRNSD